MAGRSRRADARPRRPILAGTGQYPELTAVRGIAAVMVVGTHAAYWTGHYVGGAMSLVWARLDFGVAVFFVLSGFLLFRGWVAALASREPAPSVPVYFRHRARRILPEYWLVVVVAFLVVPSAVGQGWDSFLRSLTLTQVYGGSHQHLGLTQMWSLTAEVAFYLVLPVLALLGCRLLCRGRWYPRRLFVLPAAMVVANMAWFVATRNGWVLDATSVYWLPNFLTWFAVGMALAIVAVCAEAGGVRSLVAYVRSSPGSTWVGAAALLAIVATPVGGEATLMPLPVFTATSKNLLYGAAAGLLLAPLVLGSRSHVTSWLRLRPLQWLGEISYEVFLVHLIVIEAVLRLLGYETFTGSGGYVFVLTLAGSILIAWPMHRIYASLVGRRRAPAA